MPTKTSPPPKTLEPRTGAVTKSTVDLILDRFDIHEKHDDEQISDICRKVDGIGVKVDETARKLDMHMVAYGMDQKQAEAVRETVWGNGKPGLLTRVEHIEGIIPVAAEPNLSIRLDRIEQSLEMDKGESKLPIRLDRLERWQGRLRWTLTAIAVPLLLSGIYAAFQSVMHIVFGK